LVAATGVPFFLVLFVYGRATKGRKKDRLAGAEPPGIDGGDIGGD
jgi:hypothetical protein